MRERQFYILHICKTGHQLVTLNKSMELAYKINIGNKSWLDFFLKYILFHRRPASLFQTKICRIKTKRSIQTCDASRIPNKCIAIARSSQNSDRDS